MNDRRFRFGVVAAPDRGPEQWQATAARVAELGYSTLLMPDGLQLLSPFASLAIAASSVPDLRVGTFVAAAPLRPALGAAWDAHTLSVLTGGRFDFGIGTGRDAVREFSRELGLPFGTAAERLAQVDDTIDHLRTLDGDLHTPVLIAAGGPRSRALAAAKADIVTLAAGALTSRTEMKEMVHDLFAKAGERTDQIEIAMNLAVVGDEVAPWMRQFLEVDLATLAEHDSMILLRGSVQEMADELQRRRDDFGVSYVSISAGFSEQLAPVVEKLNGR
jgi:alkanesulfonate monooxygenase SsuD/methylene tetrahydromethanopterin reductase-like flavin-dependent oxidoreductase (luciferase family)